MVHFKPKQVGKVREREKRKIIVPFRSYPTRNRKFQKNSKKIQKIKKYRYGFILSQNRLGKDSREKMKIIVPFGSIHTRRVIENSKTIEKNIQKIQKYYYGFV